MAAPGARAAPASGSGWIDPGPGPDAQEATDRAIATDIRLEPTLFIHPFLTCAQRARRFGAESTREVG
jgi:hypothetical protein